MFRNRGADGPMTTILENLFDFVLTIDYSKTFLRRIEAKTKIQYHCCPVIRAVTSTGYRNHCSQQCTRNP